MASFKGLFSAIWYVWNWRNLGQVLFVFVGGLFFLFGAAYYGTRDRMPPTPETIDLATAHERIKGTAPGFVQLTAGPDFSKKIYRTGAWAPFWGNCPPDEIWDISAETVDAAELRGLLGCAVSLSGRIDTGDARTVRWPPQATADRIKTVSLAPVHGTDEQLWVKSDIVTGPAIDLSDWRTPQPVSGVLATYDQALAGLPSGFHGYARQILPARPQAFVICPIKPYAEASMAFFTSHFWVPVKGSDRIFVWATDDAEKSDNNTVTGVLVPMALTDHEARDRSFAHFETVVGHPLPDRIGIIRYATAEAYNDKLSGYAGIFIIFGVLWTVLGLGGIVLYIIAPGLIYGAWEKAWHQLGMDPPKRPRSPIPPITEMPPRQPKPVPSDAVSPITESPAEPAKPRQPKTTTPARKTDDPDGHPLMAPFQDLDPVTEDPPPSSLDAVFKDLRAVNPEEKEQYLAFIQDFSHPNNPDSGLQMVGCDGDIKAVEDALMNAGQRHPGLAVHLLGINRARFSCTNQIPPPTPAAYDLRAGDYVVMCHAPSTGHVHRVVITAVFDESEYKARDQAETALAREKFYSLMGRVVLIGDSENGPCQALTKKSGSTLLRPL